MSNINKAEYKILDGVFRLLPDYSEVIPDEELDGLRCDLGYAKERLKKLGKHIHSSVGSTVRDQCSVCGMDIRHEFHISLPQQTEPEKIDGLTMEQWDRVIKAKQLCEFWVNYGKVIHDTLARVRDYRAYHYGSSNNKFYQFCYPIIKQGHTHAWWPEIGTDKKPEGLPDDAIICTHQEGTWFYGKYKAATLHWHPVTAFYWPVILEENNNG